MKKLLLSLAILASSMLYNNANAQVYSQGNVVIDAFYGFPNLYSTVIRGVYNNNTVYSNLKLNSLGPLGGTAEYLLSDHIGIGAEFTYAGTNAAYDYYNSTNGTTSHVKLDITRIRVLPRINIHFNGGDKVDPYLALGMGYKSVKYDYEYSDPSVNNRGDFKDVVPISTRIGFGVRYFVAPNFGLMCEFGLGGAMLRGGICTRF